MKKIAKAVTISAITCGLAVAGSQGIASAHKNGPKPNPPRSSNVSKIMMFPDGFARSPYKGRLVLHFHARVSATAIGITPGQLKTELHTGLSIVQVAANHGVTEATVSTALNTNLQAQITIALTAGRITQAQADELIALLPSKISTYINKVHRARPIPTTTTTTTTP